MATSWRLKRVRLLRMAMAITFVGFGTWCCLNPQSVIALSFNPPQKGLDNVIYGLAILIAPKTANNFRGLGMVTMLYVVWYFLSGVASANSWIWLPFAVNLFVACGSWWCARLLRDEEMEREKKREKESEKREEMAQDGASQ
ncbi:hypothetical protein VTJ49DRAFT_2514 [Mycothermus thermophilus]|uniref:Uncharacterized protein n=1 Tax=Humicola insolens TaxID=85995 RepID=A0ABR3V9Y3_HUMIN